jgi:NAD+ synthase
MFKANSMSLKKPFSPELLRIDDIEGLTDRIALKIKNDIFFTIRKRGAVIGISGGLDSSVTLALSAKALGPDKVLGVMLPEKDSSSESKTFAQMLAAKFSVEAIEENITGALDGFYCYKRRDEAVARIFPEYNPSTYKMKIGLNKSGIHQNLPPLFSLTIIDKDGSQKSMIIPINEYLQIVASSNFKQRSRMAMLYYHAEIRNYAVVGTPNKHEVEQGFFVKYGDSAADLMPISNLYKTQVYQLAEYLGVPDEIIKRTPTTDTYSAEQSQEEFFFQFPYKELDLLWYGYENGYLPEEVGPVMSITAKEVELIFNNFKRKQKATEYLRMLTIKDF